MSVLSAPWWAGQLLTPLLVSIIVAAATSTMTYQFEKRAHQRNLYATFRSDQLTAFHEAILSHKAIYLEAAELFCERMANFYRNGGRGWLSIDPTQDRYGYYIYSFSYRIVCLLAVCYQIEGDANYLRVVAAAERDGGLKLAAKVQIAAWTRASLFEGLPYDDEEARDHFYRDALEELVTAHGDQSPRPQISAFRALNPNDSHPYQDVFAFLDGLTPDEDSRYRCDRLVAVHLVTLASIRRFSASYRGAGYSHLRAVARQCRNADILRNTKKLLFAMGVEGEEGYSELVKALTDEVSTRS